MAELQNNIVNDIRRIIDESRYAAFGAVNSIAVQTYWNIGKKIVEEEQHGQDRADYGKRLIRQLSDELTKEYGNAFSKRNLDYYRKFYICFRDYEIVNACVHNLTWTHFRRVLAVASQESREWYIREASEQQWSTRELDRNISTQYYERLLSNQRKGLPLSKAVSEKADPLEYIKSPVVAEFLGFHNNSDYNESQLERALIDNLEKFIMELGQGFAFVERQKHIVTETGDFYIDLVFYNYRMKCFVLFELKTHKLSHQDIGQLDMYVRMYDDTIKDENDNPTVGVLLCTDTDSTIAKYSVLNDNDRLFAAKYMAFMPTQEELQQEIERQKQFFISTHSKMEDEQ